MQKAGKSGDRSGCEDCYRRQMKTDKRQRRQKEDRKKTERRHVKTAKDDKIEA